MKRTGLSERNPHVVVCLDSSTDLWRRLYGIARDQDRWEVRVARTAHAIPDIRSLCQEVAPVILVAEDTSFGTLPRHELSNLIIRRDLRILVFSDKTDDSSYDSFFQRGCAGVLPWEAADRTVCRAIQVVFDGELWLPRRVLSRLALANAGKETSRKLTKRESEILGLIRRGFTNHQIASQLFISRETVRWHIRSLYSKNMDARRERAAT